MTTLDRLVCLMGVKTLYSTPREKMISEFFEQRARMAAIAGESSAVPPLHLYLDGTIHWVSWAKAPDMATDPRRRANAAGRIVVLLS